MQFVQRQKVQGKNPSLENGLREEPLGEKYSNFSLPENPSASFAAYEEKP